MITAKEAKELYDKSGVEVENFVNQLEKPITEAATSGQRCVFFHIDAADVNSQIKPTALHKKVMDKLFELGYRVQFSRDGHSYVPPGLADNFGDGPKYTNYGLAIHW